MATSILALPELSMACSIESNMDWLDSIVFTDASGAAVPLDGIKFRLQVRVSADLPDVLVDASTDNGLLQLLSSGITASAGAPGSGYAIGDNVFLAGGTAVSPAVIAVTAVSVVALGTGYGAFIGQINPGASGQAGTGYAVGDQVALTGGSFSQPAIVQIDAFDSNGNISAAHLVKGGYYTNTPSNYLVIPPKAGYTQPTACSYLSYGIAGIRLTDPGIYSALPTSPAGQASSSGKGGGATFNIGQINNVLGILIPAGALVHPLIEAAAIYQIQAMADGYTQNIASGPMTVTQGIVR